MAQGCMNTALPPLLVLKIELHNGFGREEPYRSFIRSIR
jgi:hypothetical protein